MHAQKVASEILQTHFRACKFPTMLIFRLYTIQLKNLLENNFYSSKVLLLMNLACIVPFGIIHGGTPLGKCINISGMCLVFAEGGPDPSAIIYWR